MIDLSKSGRILYISSFDVSLGNGPGVNEREFILALHKLFKNRAHFLIPEPSQEISDLPKEACTFCLPHKGRHPIHFWLHAISQIRQANRILSNRNFDLVVIRLDVLPFAQLRITNSHRLPYVIKTLGTGPLKVLDEKGWYLGKALKGLNQRMFSHLVSNALVSDTDSRLHVEALQDILRAGSQKIVWIDNAVNTKRFFPVSPSHARDKLGLTQFNPIVGYIGSRPWERGGMQIIEVAPRLISKYPDIGIIILGDGKELDNMKLTARELGVSNHIYFTGYVPFEEIPTHINSLDVGVSINLPLDRQVNSELKIRQYLACGKPIVISPGSNEFVAEEKFGSTVEPNDLDQIEDQIDYWLSISDEEQNGFSQRAVKYIEENLSIEVSLNDRIALWTERLEEHNNRAGL